jgi:nucleoporin POM152
MGGENLKPPICVGSQDFVQIKIQGSPPFTIFYIHNFTQMGGDPSNISEKKQVISQPQVFDENSREYTGYIYLESANSGTNTYHFLSITDSNYDTPIRLGNSLSIEQRVDAAPTAEFVDNQDITFHCLSEKPGEVVLPIKLTGIAPFVLNLQKKYDHGEIERFSITVDDESLLVKNGSRIFQYEPEKILLIGSYTFDIISIQDSTSCEVHYQNDSPGLDSLKSISIHIVDQAKVISNNPSVLCVGDMLTYGLQGTAPFTIGYSWNGIAMKDLVVTDPILTLFAAEPGILSIDKICNSMMCCAQSSGTSIVDIKDIPSAIVDGGEDIVEDIREGEESVMLVEFKGTPPFSISWSRSEIGEDKQSDSFSVSNIETFRYSISTQQEGIFTVTAVSDKVIGFKINTHQYCSFPRAVQDSSLANAILKSG